MSGSHVILNGSHVILSEAKNLRVLLVEDELSLASIVKDALETQEFEVTIAANGAEGLGEFQFNPETAQLLHSTSGESIILPRREADILLRLCEHRGEVVPTQNILLDLWGDDDFFNARSLQVLITRLRRALSKDSRLQILNVRGTGYKLIAE